MVIAAEDLTPSDTATIPDGMVLAFVFVGDGPLAGEPAGYWLELAAPMGTQDYSYVIGLFVRGGELVVAEAAGEVARLASHREAIIAAMSELGER